MASSQNNKLPGRKKALGRGLSALIPSNSPERASNAPREYFECALDQIDPAPIQPRKNFEPEALSDLSASIKESGLIQPLVVRRKEGRYELIAGERRWRASKMAGLRNVPVVVKDVNDSVAFALALIENIQRKDLNPVEEALAYRRLLDEFGFTQSDLANQLGKSRSAVANSVRLLALPDDVLTMLADESISSGHARALLSLSQEQANATAHQIAQEQWTVRQTEQVVRDIKDPSLPLKEVQGFQDVQDVQESAKGVHIDKLVAAPADKSVKVRDDEKTRAFVKNLTTTWNTQVRLKDHHGHGRLEIHYDSYDSLKSILDSLKVDAALD